MHPNITHFKEMSETEEDRAIVSNFVLQEFFGFANSFMQPRGYGGAAAGGPVLLHQQQWLLQRNEKLG